MKTSSICNTTIRVPALRFTSLLAGALACISGSASAATFTWDGSVNTWPSVHWLDSGSVLVAGGTGAAITDTYTINSGTVNFTDHDTFDNAGANPQLTINVNGGTLSNEAAAFGQAFTTLGLVNLTSGTITSTGGALGGFEAFQLKNTVTSSGASFINTTGTPANFNGFHVTNNIFNVTGGTLTVSAPLINAAGGGTAGFTKSGTGTMVLSGANGYTGNTFVAGGTLQISGGTIAGPGIMDIGANAATPANFTLNSGSVTVGSQFVIGAHGSTGTAAIDGGALQVNGTIYVGGYGEGTGTGTITQTAGAVTSTAGVNFGGGGPNNGIYNLSGGTLTTTTLSKSGGGTAIFNFNGGTLKPSANTAAFLQGLTAANVQSGGGTIDTNGFDITIAQALLDGGGNGGLVKSGAGTLTLTNAASSFAGNVTINGGTVLAAAVGGGTTSTLGAANVARTITVNSGGTLQFNAHDTFGNDATTTPVAVVIAAGGLVKSNLTYTTLPSLTLNGGELRADGGAVTDYPAFQLRSVAVGGASASQITATGAAVSQIALGQTGGDSATFTVANATGNTNTDLTVSAVLRNSATGSFASGLTKAGPGTMELSAVNLYTGPTTVNAGTLLVSGSISGSAVTVNGGTLGGSGGTVGATTVNSGGTLAPGASIGTLNFASSMTLAGTAVFEINKTGFTLTADLANVMAGTLTLGGTLNVTATGDALTLGNTFDLFDAAAFAGSFATLNLPSLGGGLTWDTSSLASNGTLAVVPEPGTAISLLGGLGLLLGLRRRRA